MASRHSTGFSLFWPETRDVTSSMRVECTMCGRGAKFPWASVRHLPDFSSSVFIALTGFPHGVFLSPAQWKGLSSRLIQPHSPSQSLPDQPLRIPSWLVCPDFPLYAVQISILLNSAIFLYTAGPATFECVL